MTNQFLKWNVDASGNFTSGDPMGVVGINNPALWAVETQFGQELNNDGQLGVVDVFSFSSGDIGLPTDNNYASIYNFNAGDRITYSSGVMSIVGNSVPPIPGKASIDLSTGIASFDSTDMTLAQQLSAVERAISDVNLHAKGHMAMWAKGSDTFMLITDDRNGVTDGDTLIRIVDIQPHQLRYDATQYVVLA
jgi:hypothetical protein